MDARSLLGSLLEAGMSPSTQKRIGNALGASGLGKALGGAGAAPGKPGAAGGGGFPMGAAGLGALAGAVLGGRKGDTMRGVIGGGALAVLGKLAYDAMQQRSGAQQGAGGAGATAAGAAAGTTLVPGGGWGATPTPAAPADEDAGARLLLQAMVSAAKADGQIDGNEMQRILKKLDESGADAEGKGFLIDEMRKPLDVDGLARQAKGSPEAAAQVYAASLLAIEVDTAAERDYLRRLATALGLDDATVGRLHEAVGAGR